MSRLFSSDIDSHFQMNMHVKNKIWHCHFTSNLSYLSKPVSIYLLYHVVGKESSV